MRGSKSIDLEIHHDSNIDGRVLGFRYLWAYYVSGYNPEKHCQPCFIGRRAEHFCTPRATTGRHVFDRIDRFPYLYVCGVGSGPKDQLRHRNLHLPVRYEAGGVVEATTYNEYRFRLTNAALMEIPELPAGWRGKPTEHTRCKNLRFAVSVFGEPK